MAKAEPQWLIERDEQTGKFNVLWLARDGVYDVLSDHNTRAEARAAMALEIAEERADHGAERHYWAQHAYACGERD